MFGPGVRGKLCDHIKTSHPSEEIEFRGYPTMALYLLHSKWHEPSQAQTHSHPTRRSAHQQGTDA